MKYFNQITKLILLISIALFSIEGSGQTSSITYIHTDHLGSPIMASDEAGVIKWKEGYQPFGKTIEGDDTDNEVGFTGHLKDKSIGLTYMQGRWYSAKSGRFMALDPILFRDTHSFNRYVYANNNPYKYIDPDGQAPDHIHARRARAIARVIIPKKHLKMYDRVTRGSRIADLIDRGKIKQATALINKNDKARIKKVQPIADAKGAHTTWKKDPQTGEITRHETYKPNPQNPSGWDKTQSTDIKGAPHINKKTGESVPTPHTQDKDIPGGVRSAARDEIPKT